MESEVNSEGIALNFHERDNYFGCINPSFVVVQPVWSLSKVFLGVYKAVASLMLLLSQPQPLRSSEEEGPRRPASQLGQPGAAGTQGRQPVLSALQRRHHLSRK